MTPYARYSAAAQAASKQGWRLKLTEVKDDGWAWSWWHEPTGFRFFGETTAAVKPVALVLALDSVSVIGVF